MRNHFKKMISMAIFTSLFMQFPLGSAAASSPSSEKVSRPSAQSAEEKTRIRAIEIGLAATVTISPAPNSQQRGGTASGFVFDSQGHVVTNAHVVGTSQFVTLTTRDGRSVTGRVIGRDLRSDIAVIRSETPLNIDPLKFSTDIPAVGRAVFAIGSPMGFRLSVTRGIISGHDRYYDVNWPVALLQHDAALNPGNSGGPLIDSDGRVVGMNTATPPTTLYDIGIGLALPTSVILDIVPSLIRDGFIRRGALGVQVSAADPTVGSTLGSGGRSGLLVDTIVPGGAAERAGLMAGDLLLSINEIPVTFARDIQRITLPSQPGESVVVEFLREGEFKRIVVHLQQDRPDDGLRVRALVADEQPDRESIQAGLVFGSQSGARVELTDVRAGSAADREGLQRGDLILGINGRAIASVAEAQAAVVATRGDLLILRIERPGREVRHVILALSQKAASMRQIGNPDEQPSGPI